MVYMVYLIINKVLILNKSCDIISSIFSKEFI